MTDGLLEILKYLGPDFAFPAILIFAVLWFLLKVLKPVFGATNETFKAYLKVIRDIKEEIRDAKKALEGIEINTRHGRDE